MGSVTHRAFVKLATLGLFGLLALGSVMADYDGVIVVPVKAGSATDSFESGAMIFERACISCHGADGKGKTPRGIRKGAADLTKSKISVAKGRKIIKYGRGSMPEFKDRLTWAEIVRVNSYVRGLRK